MRIDIDRLRMSVAHDARTPPAGWQAPVVVAPVRQRTGLHRPLLAATNGSLLVLAQPPDRFRAEPRDYVAGRDVSRFVSYPDVAGGSIPLAELRAFAGPPPVPCIIPCRHDQGAALEWCECQDVPGLGYARESWSRWQEWGAFRFQLPDGQHVDRGFDLAQVALALSCVDAHDTRQIVDVALVTTSGRPRAGMPILSVTAHDREWRVILAGSAFYNDARCDSLPRLDVVPR